MATPKTEHLSQSAYARHRRALGLSGTTHGAVQRAIESGRLDQSLVMVGGVAKIRNAAAADSEWEANTRARAPEPERFRAQPHVSVSYEDYEHQCLVTQELAAAALRHSTLEETLAWIESRAQLDQSDLWIVAEALEEADDLEQVDRKESP